MFRLINMLSGSHHSYLTMSQTQALSERDPELDTVSRIYDITLRIPFFFLCVPLNCKGLTALLASFKHWSLARPSLH